MTLRSVTDLESWSMEIQDSGKKVLAVYDVAVRPASAAVCGHYPLFLKRKCCNSSHLETQINTRIGRDMHLFVYLAVLILQGDSIVKRIQ
jgi:hypothetical protein